MAKIIFTIATRVIRGPYTNAEPLKAGESERDITAQEAVTIDALRTVGAKAVVDDLTNGLRVATLDEADERKTFRESLIDRIKAITSLTTRATAYQAAPSILLAMAEGDKLGAKAIADTLTMFPAQQITRLKALIDAA